MEEVELLKRRIVREQRARKEAERILEQKALELHETNEQLQLLNDNLEQKIQERTEALERSEKRYRLIVESAEDFIFRTDPKGYFTYVNPVVYSKFGYTAKDLIGTHFTEIIPKGFQDDLMNMYINYRESQLLNSYQEFPVVAKNGDIYWVGQNIQFILENGIVIEVTGVARDITERKLTEEALTTTQLRMTSLIKNLHSGILVEDENRKVILANRLYCKHFNIHHSPQELVGTDCSLSAIRYKHLFITPDQYATKIEEIIAGKKPVTGLEFHMTNGKILEQDYIPITDGNRHLGHLWQYRDITQKYHAKEALRKSEEKYRGILENMELGLMEVDNDQTILKVYDWFCDMTGYTEEELIGKNAQEVFLSDTFAEQMAHQQEDRKKGEAGVYEIQIRKKDGEPIWVLVSGAPITNSEGEVTGSVGIHYDISKQKKLLKDLEDAKRQAEAAEKAEKQFLARMSHEIRTPLNAIIGISHLLEDTTLDMIQRDYVDSIQSSSNILQKLISDILDLSKITAGGLEVHPRLFDLRGTIKSLEKTFRLKLQEQPINFNTEVDDGINTMMIGDDLLLNQILLNLIGNAVKFTKQGSIHLSVQIEKVEGSKHWLTFTISDTGIGIQQDRLASIFENFKQADNEIRFQFGGTGLGLPITKKLVELQNGSITVKSKPDEGTTFQFKLPYEKSNQSIAIKAPKEQPFNDTLDAKILVAEDNIMNRKYISALLKKWNLEFEFALNGKEAVELAQFNNFDLILMDISMPEMDGYDATIHIRNTNNPNQSTPIIALTANALVAQKTRSEEVGMTDFLAKPFKPEQLKKVIEKYKAHKKLENYSNLDTDVNGFAFPSELDLEHLGFLYNGDLHYAEEMFGLFLDYTLIEFEKLHALLNEEKLTDFQKLVHKLKPNFSIVGLTNIENQLAQLEQSTAKKLTLNELKIQFAAITKNIQKHEPIIKATLTKIQHSLERV